MNGVDGFGLDGSEIAIDVRSQRTPRDVLFQQDRARRSGGKLLSMLLPDQKAVLFNQVLVDALCLAPDPDTNLDPGSMQLACRRVRPRRDRRGLVGTRWPGWRTFAVVRIRAAGHPGEVERAAYRRTILRSTPVRRAISRWLIPPPPRKFRSSSVVGTSERYLVSPFRW